jgi:hypothetical protein
MIQNLSWKEFGINLITGNGSVPLYFIVVLFQLYLIYPFIADLSKERWFVYTSFWFSLIFFYLHPFVYLLEVPTLFRFFFFFVWGIYMREQLLLGRLRREWLPWAVIIALCVLVYVIFPGQYFNVRLFYGLGVMSLLFMLFTSSMNFGVVEKLLAWVGSMSLWIFLTHFTLMEYMLPYLWSSVDDNPYWALIATMPVSIVGSILFGYVCTKIYNSAVLVFSGRVKKG